MNIGGIKFYLIFYKTVLLIRIFAPIFRQLISIKINMSNDIRIKKGLDINLKGEAEKSVEQAIISLSLIHIFRAHETF